MKADELNGALEKFDSTRAVIAQIVEDLASELPNQLPGGTKGKVIKAMKETLDPDNRFDLQYGGAIKGKFQNEPEKYKNSKEPWVKAIYFYQKEKQKYFPLITVCGYLIPDGKTNEPFKNDIREKLGLPRKSPEVTGQ